MYYSFLKYLYNVWTSKSQEKNQVQAQKNSKTNLEMSYF